MKMTRDRCGTVEVTPTPKVSLRDMKRVARFANAVGAKGRFKIERPTCAQLREWGYEVRPGHDFVFDIKTGEGSVEWYGEGDDWFATEVMRLVQMAGHVTVVWTYRKEGFVRCEAMVDDGEDGIEVLAWCSAPTMATAAMGIALWAYRELRRARGRL